MESRVLAVMYLRRSGRRDGCGALASFYTNPLDPSYSASKAAEWSLTNGIRMELSPQSTLVVAVHASQLPRDHELIYAPLQQIFFALTEGSC
jgi:short-subunit dehydrogenase